MRIAIVLSLLASVFFSSGSLAQTPLAVTSVEDLHQGLRQLQAVMEKALNSNDIDTILQNVDEQVIFTTMNGDTVRGKEGIRKYYEQMMTGPNRVVESVLSDFVPDDLSILHGDDTAIAFGHTNDHYTLAGGQKLDINARWSGTMFRQNGKWIVASFHYSTNMFDNPVLSMQRRALITAGIVAVLVVGGLAFWLGRRQRRKAV